MFTNKVIILAVTIGSAVVGEAATALYVPGDFATIQACIDAAVSGVDECVVAPGTYHETINLLGKAITLRSSGGADVTIIDATGIGGSVVTCASGEDPDTVLDGFTITGGTGTTIDPGYTSGGGMVNVNSSPTVINCAFIRNEAYFGGGVSNYSYSNPGVTNCTFSGNTTEFGGGMFNIQSSPTVTNSKFSTNSARYGGGSFNDGGTPKVTNCAFSGNTAVFGGGIFNFDANPTVTNCTFSGNRATGSGGGIYNDQYSSSTVSNCTFITNIAISGGGMYGGGTVANCIFWGDSLNEIVNRPYERIIRFSDVQGGLPVGAVDGGGNINLDPMFVRVPDPGPDGTWDGVDDDYGDLRLQAGSPCIDAGDPAFVAQPGETDLDGHSRVLCGVVDMGAYEFGIGDYNCDRVVNLADFAGWAACMTGPSNADTAVAYDLGCEAFDFDGDGDVDLFDFNGFQIIIEP